MHDLLLALCFVSFVVAPCIVAAHSSREAGQDSENK